MAGPIRIAILANGRQARAEIQRTNATLGGIGATATKAGKLLAAGLGAATAARAASAFVRSGAGYVDSLNKIKVLTGATAAEMKRAAGALEGNASRYAKMGQTTSDAAAGVVELTKAGLSLGKSVKAVNATMVLAKAGELDVADASTLVANTLNTFSLRASRAGDIANYLANAANISSADVSDLAESFKYVSPLAASAGLSLAQTNAALAELANAGLKGSQAGTGLRKFLASLQSPVGKAAGALDDLGVKVYDSTGKMRPFGDLIADLAAKIRKLPQSKQNRTLRDIFGLQGITAAQVLLKNGVKGLDDYTDGVKKAGAAQKLANAQTKGLVGTLSKIKAGATSAGQAFYRKYSPAVDDALQNTLDFGKKALDAFKAIPGPVKSVGVEVGVAALVFPRLVAGLTAAKVAIVDQITYLRVLKLEMSDTAVRSQTLAAGMVRLGRMAKMAAGIGGMAALVDGAHRSEGALKSLETTLGAAAVGFSLGGPLGGVIGAAAGGLYTVRKASRATARALDEQNAAMKRADDAASGAKPHLVDYAKTLDQVTGAATRATRAAVLQKLQQDGIIDQAAPLGLSARTLVSATLGQYNALKRVNNAWRTHQDVLSLTSNSHVQQWIENQNNAFRDQQAKIQQNTAVVQHYSRSVLAKLPRAVRTKVRADGIEASASGVAELVRKYKIVDKKTIRTLIKLSGAKASVKDVEALAQQMRGVGRVKVDNKSWLGSLSSTYNVAARGAKKNAQDIGKSLTNASKVKASDAWLRSMLGIVDRGRTAAYTGGHGVGASLKAGLLAGMAGMAQQAAHNAAAAVAAAIAAARSKKGADANSPSRKTIRLGRDMVDGLVVGINERRAAARHSGAKLIQHVLKGARESYSSVDSVLEKYVKKNTKLRGKKLDELLRKHKLQIKQLVAEAKGIDKVTKAYKGQNYTLTKAQALLKQRKATYRSTVATIRQSIIDSANLTQLSVPFTPEGEVAGLQHAVEKAKQYQRLLNRLKKAGLNKATLKQLTDAGVQGGLATAQALADGIGKGTIAKINNLMGQLTGTNGVGQKLGTSVADYMDKAGIKAASALVKGLKKKQGRLEAQFKNLAHVLLNELTGKKVWTAKDVNTTPRISAKQVVVNGPTKSEPLKVNIHLSAQQISQLQRGKQIQADLDAYRRNGGKGKRAA